mmetsp:Transcript_10570/g.23304  ORF Transcript_10570/g.23304 Transcript_10570/m.23304 type:complete len:203 (-) Transcript_10570:245-853(-)
MIMAFLSWKYMPFSVKKYSFSPPVLMSWRMSFVMFPNAGSQPTKALVRVFCVPVIVFSGMLTGSSTLRSLRMMVAKILLVPTSVRCASICSTATVRMNMKRSGWKRPLMICSSMRHSQSMSGWKTKESVPPKSCGKKACGLCSKDVGRGTSRQPRSCAAFTTSSRRLESCSVLASMASHSSGSSQARSRVLFTRNLRRQSRP